jgi:hypothetical protein
MSRAVCSGSLERSRLEPGRDGGISDILPIRSLRLRPGSGDRNASWGLYFTVSRGTFVCQSCLGSSGCLHTRVPHRSVRCQQRGLPAGRSIPDAGSWRLWCSQFGGALPCSPGNFCGAGLCQDCNVPEHCGMACVRCPVGRRICLRGQCIECTSDDQYPAARLCEQGACRPPHPCTTDDPCSHAKVCFRRHLHTLREGSLHTLQGQLDMPGPDEMPPHPEHLRYEATDPLHDRVGLHDAAVLRCSSGPLQVHLDSRYTGDCTLGRTAPEPAAVRPGRCVLGIPYHLGRCSRPAPSHMILAYRLRVIASPHAYPAALTASQRRIQCHVARRPGSWLGRAAAAVLLGAGGPSGA